MAVAAGLLGVALARLEGVVIGEQPLDRVLQQPLFVGQREVHVTAPESLWR